MLYVIMTSVKHYHFILIFIHLDFYCNLSIQAVYTECSLLNRMTLSPQLLVFIPTIRKIAMQLLIIIDIGVGRQLLPDSAR